MAARVCEECTDAPPATHSCVQCDILLCEVRFARHARSSRACLCCPHRSRRECFDLVCGSGMCLLLQECFRQHRKSKRTAGHETRCVTSFSSIRPAVSSALAWLQLRRSLPLTRACRYSVLALHDVVGDADIHRANGVCTDTPPRPAEQDAPSDPVSSSGKKSSPSGVSAAPSGAIREELWPGWLSASEERTKERSRYDLIGFG